MNILEGKVGNQVQFWSLLGPFLILSSIAVLLFKVSDRLVFSVECLSGNSLMHEVENEGHGSRPFLLIHFICDGLSSIGTRGALLAHWHGVDDGLFFDCVDTYSG